MISFTLQQSPKLANDKQAPLNVNNAVIKTKITYFGSLQFFFFLERCKDSMDRNHSSRQNTSDYPSTVEKKKFA